VTGQLLYAVLGYEARPGAVQALSWLLSASAVPLVLLLARRTGRADRAQT